MDALITLYIDEIRKIDLKHRYKVFTFFVLLIVIIGGFSCSSLEQDLIMKLYPYTVLTITNFVFTPIAFIMLAIDIIRPKRGKELLPTALAVISFIFKTFLSVFMASSVLSVVFGGIDSISLAEVMKAYIVNYVFIAIVSAMAVYVTALVKGMGI